MNVINSTYPNSIRPKYMVHSGPFTLLSATQHAGASGFWCLYNPIESKAKVFVREIVCRSTQTSALVTLTAPRLAVTRFSYTGTITATAIPSGKKESSQPTANALAVSAGMGTAALTVGATLASFLIVGSMTAVGTAESSEQRIVAGLGDEIVLAAGEGLVFNQADASTTSDTRKVMVDVTWEEGV